MTKKEAFIKIVQEEIFDRPDIYGENNLEVFDLAFKFWEEFKNPGSSEKITENGQKILRWLQENMSPSVNAFTAKEIAEGLSTTGRSVAGSMRKLVKDEYVEKQGKDPIQYSLTAKGEDWS